MIKIDKSDICMLHAELMDAYVQLNDFERKVIDADNVVIHLTQAVESIKELGNTPQVRDFYKVDAILESLTHRDPNFLSVASACEGIGNAISEAFKKFVAYIKELLAKIAVFFQRLFNVVDKKAKEVMTAIRFLNFDKPVSLLKKEKIIKLGVTANNLNKHLMTHISISPMEVRFISGMKEVLNKFSMAHPGVLVPNGDGLKLDDSATAFENMTLKEAQLEANDIRGICVSYLDRSKSIGPIKSGFVKMMGFFDTMNYAGVALASGQFNDIRLAIKTDAFMYSLTGKIQSIIARNIMSFYKCIDDGEIVYEPEVVDDGTHALPNKAA